MMFTIGLLGGTEEYVTTGQGGLVFCLRGCTLISAGCSDKEITDSQKLNRRIVFEAKGAPPEEESGVTVRARDVKSNEAEIGEGTPGIGELGSKPREIEVRPDRLSDCCQ
jgi:hypothetical protein